MFWFCSRGVYFVGAVRMTCTELIIPRNHETVNCVENESSLLHLAQFYDLKVPR